MPRAKAKAPPRQVLPIPKKDQDPGTYADEGRYPSYGQDTKKDPILQKTREQRSSESFLRTGWLLSEVYTKVY